MQNSGKRKPLHVTLLTALLLCAVPLALSWVIESVLNIAQPINTALNASSARSVGFALGFLFHLTCILGGLLREPFRSFKYRISEFFQDIHCSLRFAIEGYWENLWEDGFTFAAILLVMLATLGYSLYNLQIALKLLHLI